MKSEEITTLAREYADMLKHLFPDMPKHTYRDKMSQAKNVINIIMRRYCLVEKERVKDEYHEAKFACGNVDPCSETWATYQAQKSLLERLFPDLGKEVEE